MVIESIVSSLFAMHKSGDFALNFKLTVWIMRMLQNSDNVGLCPFLWQYYRIFKNELNSRILPAASGFWTDPEWTRAIKLVDTV